MQHVRIVGQGNSQSGSAVRWNSITEVCLLGASTAGGALRAAAPNAAALSYTLDGNYPNPFHPTTEIRFTVPQAQRVTLVVYDLLGRAVACLLGGPLEAGQQRVCFDAWGQRDVPLPPPGGHVRANAADGSKRAVGMSGCGALKSRAGGGRLALSPPYVFPLPVPCRASAAFRSHPGRPRGRLLLHHGRFHL